MTQAQKSLERYKQAYLVWIANSKAQHLPVIRDAVTNNVDRYFSLYIRKKELTSIEVHQLKMELYIAITNKDILLSV